MPSTEKEGSAFDNIPLTAIDTGFIERHHEALFAPGAAVGMRRHAGTEVHREHLRTQANAEDGPASCESPLEESQLIRDPRVTVRFVHRDGAAEADHQVRRRDIDVAQTLPAGLHITDLETALAQNSGKGAAVFEVNVPDGKGEAGRIHEASLPAKSV